MSYTWECPVYGPRDNHLFADEDTGEYRAYCECGARDYRDEPKPVTVPAGDDEPPF